MESFIPKRVVVGSINPVKLNAVRDAFVIFFAGDRADQWEYISYNVPSGVSEQPMSDEEAIRGAKNRVFKAEKIDCDADFYVGIEAGVIDRISWMEVFDWIYVKTKEKETIGCTGRFILPEKVVELVRFGKNLSSAMDMCYKTKDIGKKEGAIGLLSKGKISRTKYTIHGILLALSGL